MTHTRHAIVANNGKWFSVKRPVKVWKKFFPCWILSCVCVNKITGLIDT